MSISQRLKEAVCKVKIGTENSVMAFAINNDYFLSVGHAFVNCSIGDEFQASFVNKNNVNVKLLEFRFDRKTGFDCAILKNLDNTKVIPLPLAFAKEEISGFVTVGSGEILSGFSSAEGRIIGNHHIDESNYMFKLHSHQSGQLGFSGSPIFSTTSNSVVAIQCEATDNDMGAERDTVLAFPLARLLNTSFSHYLYQKPIISSTEFIENYLLPSFGRSILCLEHSDNLNAYMRCIVVKLLPERGERFTVFVANGSSDKETIVPAIRKHHTTRKMKYGIVGGMIKTNVPILYDFVNDKCYKLGLGGTSIEYNGFTKNTKGAKEGRAALLVAPIRALDGSITGVLSFDFFSPTNPNKNIINKIKDDPSEIGRMLYISDLYAQTISQLLLKDYFDDVDFFFAQP